MKTRQVKQDGEAAPRRTLRGTLLRWTVRIVVVGLVVAVIGLVGAVVAVRVGLTTSGATPEPAAERPVGRTLNVVAIGDSYMSGEGAGTFYQETDRPGADLCHRAPTAWPVRVTDALRSRLPAGYESVSLTFVACSGAQTMNVLAGTSFSDPDQAARSREQYPTAKGGSRYRSPPSTVSRRTSSCSAWAATTHGSATS